jgi:flagellar hook-associated protein 1 FlgK
VQSTFLGIELAKRSLNAQNQALNTIGHNLANASAEGYSRERVDLAATDPLYAPDLSREETPGQIGQGVSISRIERIKDDLLEGRIDAESGLEGYWGARDKYLLQLEQIHNEPSDSSVRAQMDKFWDSWQELSLRPSDTAAREAVLSRGENLAESMRDRFRRLTGFRSEVDGDVRGTVTQVNNLAKEIAAVDLEIRKSKAIGDEPNDLMDRRDVLVEKLGHLIPISVDQRGSDEFMVHVDGIVLVQGDIARGFDMKTATDDEGFAAPIWKDTGLPAAITGGTLGALIGLRDGDAKKEMQTLDTMALTFADLVNETHRAAYGVNGKTGLDFFKEWPFINNVAGNYDRNGDGKYDSTYIYRMTGANALTAQEQVGLAGTIKLSSAAGTTEVAYYPTDTVADLVSRINHAGAEVTARLTREGKLELRATPAANADDPSFVLRHVEDSGQFLVGYSGLLQGSGAGGAYDWGHADATGSLRTDGVDFAVAPIAHPAGWLEVAPEIKSDLGSIAAGFGENGRPAAAGDGSAALAIAALRTQNVMVGSLKTFDDHFAEAVARVGLSGERAASASATHDKIGKELRDLRQSTSGVNMDEELANMIKFQHGYEAAAKFVTKVDSMLDTIINRMGA